MSWAQQEVVPVTDYGGYTPYPCLDHVTDDRFKSVANGGQCETAYDLAYYSIADGSLLEFEIELHDLTTGELSAWVNCPVTLGAYVRKWSDASVVSSLADHSTMWSDYLTSPVLVPGPTVSATGFVFHCHDNAASQVVVNSVVGSANVATINPSPPFNTSVVSISTPFGLGLDLVGGGSGTRGILVTPDVLDFLGGEFGSNDNTHIHIELHFKTPSSFGGTPHFTGNQYFALAGYVGFLSGTGAISLYSGGGAGSTLTGPVLDPDTWYYVTWKIDDLVGRILIGRNVVATGALTQPYAESGNYTACGDYGTPDGIVDEWRMALRVVEQRSISTLTSFDPCAMATAEIWGALRVKNYAATGGEDDDTFTTYLFSEARKPLNDYSTGNYGGKKRPCLLDPGIIPRKMSDLITGLLSSETHTITLDDTDHYWTDVRARHGGSLKDAECWLYLDEAEWRQAGGAPIPLNHGFTVENVFRPGMSLKLDILNPIAKDQQLAFMRSPVPSSGSRLSRKIPQRVIRGVNTFAGSHIFQNFVDQDLSNPRAVPFSMGPCTDVDWDTTYGYVVGGRGKAICLGELTGISPAWVFGLCVGHDAKDGIQALYQPSGPDDVGLIPDADPDALWPGQVTAGWATVNPSGAALYTDLDGYDQISGGFAVSVERFLLFAVKGDRATKFQDGSGPIYFNILGPTDSADGLGTEMTDATVLKPWALHNWILRKPGYLSGAYYTTPPTFDFFPGGDPVDVLDMDSIARSASLLSNYEAIAWGGLVGGQGDQQELEQVVADMNRSSFSPMTWNNRGQLTDCVFDFTRATFLRTLAILDELAKRGIVAPPASSESVPFNYFISDLAINFMYSWRTNKYEGNVQQLGLAGGHDQFGPGPTSNLTISGPFLADPTSAAVICARMLAITSIGVPSLFAWARTWCGLEDDIGDGRAISHRMRGLVDDAHWILEQSFAVKDGQVRNVGLLVESALVEE